MYKPFFDRDFLLNSSILTDSVSWLMPKNDFELKALDFSKAAPATVLSAKPVVETLYMDDYTANSSTTGVLSLVSSTSGNFETVGDADWFSVTLTQGQSLTVATMGGMGTGLSLHNSDGSVASAPNFALAGPEEYYTFEDMNAGTYYLQVEENGGFAPMNYTVSARAYVDDFAGDSTTTGVANVDGTGTTSSLQSATDADWFAFTVGAGDIFELLVSFSPEPLIRIVDSMGTTIASDSTGMAGADMYAEYSTLAPGTYYVEMRPDMYNGSPSNYSFNARQYADDFGDDTTTMGTLSTSGTASGTLQGYGDADWFEMTLTAGQEIVIRTTGLDLVMQPLELRDAAGTVIGSTSVDLPEGTLTYTPTVSGTYYASVRIDRPGGFSATSYTLSTLPEDDFAGDNTTTGLVSFSGATSGSIEVSGDTDWFSVTVAEGETLRVFSDTMDTAYRLMNSDGSVASTGQSYFGGPFNNFAFDDLSAGTYYLEVSATNGPYAKDYSFGASTFIDDHGDEAATATDSSVSMSGIIENGADEDWFSIDITAGEDLEISYGGGFPGPSIIANLVDVAGNSIPGGIALVGAGASYIGYEGLAAGTYYVRVQGTGPGDTAQGYTFDAVSYVDDHGDTAATATSLARLNGADTGVLSGPTDSDVFTVDLVAGEVFHFTTTGLPSGFDQVEVTMGNSNVNVGKAPHETSFSFTPTVTGTYNITVSLDPMFGSAAPVDYTVSTAIPDDFGNTAGTAGSLARFSTTFGTIEQPSDADWFSVSVANGQSLVVGENSSDFEFRLLNADGTVASEGTDFVDGNFFREVFGNLDGGTYYVEVTAPTGTHPLDYQMTSTFFTDDHGNTLDEATATGFINGRIDIPADVDWFEFTLDADMTVDEIFEVSRDVFSIGDGFLFNFRDANGNIVAPEVSSATSFGLVQQFEGLVAGTYYIEVFDDPNINSFGRYRIITNLHSDDHESGINTSSTIPLDGTVSGTLQSLIDEDWFSVNLTAGEELRVNSTLFGAGQGFMRLVDSNGNNVNGLPINNLDLLFTPTEDGQYFVVVSRDNFPAVTGEIGYTLTTGIPDDFADNTTTTGVVNLNGTTTGIIENIRNLTDVDWFAIDLAAGETTEVTFSSFSDQSYSFFDSNGNQVANAFMGSGIASFEAQSAGTYYVAVTETREALAQDVNYNFMTTTYFDDYAAGVSTTAMLTPGSSISGTYNSRNDVDWIAINIDAGQTVKIDLNQSRFTTDLRLVDGNGTTLAFEQSDNVRGTSFVAYTATQAGTYYIQTSATSFSGPQAYEINANIVAPDIPDNTSSTATIATGGAVDGVLEQSFDDDWFGFSATDGELIRFTLEGPFASQVTLNIYSDMGVLLSQFSSLQRDNTTEVLTFDAPATGNFFVGVDARFLSNSFTDYTLTAQNVADDFAGDATTTAVIAPGGTITGGIDLRNDVDWIAFNMSEDDIISFNIEAEFSTGNMRIVDAGGNTLQTAYNIGTGSNAIDFLAATTGTFYLSFSNFVEGFNYSVTASTVTDDYGNDITTTDNLVTGSFITGAIDYRGDTDWFSISVSDGETIHTLLRDIDSNPTTLRTSLYDSAGNLIVSSAYSTFDSELVFTFDIGGDYFLAVESFPSTNGLRNSDYSLSLNTVGQLGTSASDILTGTAGADIIVGLGSRDLIQGFEGDDIIFGGDGGDRIEGGAGADNIDGGTGSDYVAFSSSDAGVNVNLLTGFGFGGHAEGDTYTNVEWIVGSSFDDVLVGNIGFNFIVGGNGADIMSGGDRYQGDSFSYRRLNGHMDGDIITDFGFNDYIGMFSVWETEAYTPNFIGTDAFSGRAGEIRYERSGEDTLVLVDTNGDGTVNETLTLLGYSGGLTMDVNFYIQADSALLTGDFDSNFTGTEFDNVVVAQGGDDTYFGLAGDDYFEGGEGNDFFNGGEGNDTSAYLEATSRVFVDLALTGPQDTQGAGVDTLINVENVTGSDFNDILFGNGGDNVLDGGAGNDYIEGRGGDDTIIGGSGNSDWSSYVSASSGVTVDLNLTGAQDTGGAGIDTLSGIENLDGSAFKDNLTGDGGNNYIDGRGGDDLIEGGAGNDILDGGAGDIDVASYAGATSAVTVSLDISGAQDTMGAGIDTLMNFEALLGSDHNDVLTGNSGDNGLDGGLGDDFLDGRGGIDTVSYFSIAGGVVVDLSIVGPQDTVSAGLDTFQDIENIFGSLFDDTLLGDGSDNIIFGFDGDDVLGGGLGNDTLIGGVGSDMATYQDAASNIFIDLGFVGPQNTLGAGIDTLVDIENVTGSDFRDILLGNARDNVLVGGAGNDYLEGGGGDDTVIGGLGNSDWSSYVSASAGVNVNLSIMGSQDTGGAGIDTLSNIENLDGSAFNDVLVGDSGNNFLDGRAGDDVLEGGIGNDMLFGGSGDDTASYASATSGVLVDLGLTIQQDTVGAGLDVLSSIENLIGSDFDDILLGNAGDNSLLGLDGDDTLGGGLGNDVLDGGTGIDTATYVNATSRVFVDLNLLGLQDTLGGGIDRLIDIENLTGSGFNDILLGNSGDNVLVGGAGNDYLEGGDGDDTVIGGLGNSDWSSYVSASAGVSVNLSIMGSQDTGGAGIDTLSDIENLDGSAFNDVLVGDSGNNFLDGRAGDDVLEGGVGNDMLFGGSGNDTASYASATGNVFIDLDVSTQQNTIGAGLDVLSSIENLIGSDFRDILYGNDGDNDISGGAGQDYLMGGLGDDNLDGGAGNSDWASYRDATARVFVDLSDTGPQDTLGAGVDTLTGIENLDGTDFNDILFGDAGNNVIDGHAGNDYIQGGAGNDILMGGLGTSDWVSYVNAAGSVFVDLSLTTAQDTGAGDIDTLSGLENLEGSNFGDILIGTSGDNYIDGQGGNDFLDGGMGNDILDGGTGVDMVSYALATSGVFVDLSNISAQDTLGGGIDQLIGVEQLEGSDFRDVLYGTATSNYILGGDENDYIDGGDAGDFLDGGAGASDWVSYLSASSGVTVSLSNTGVQNTGGSGQDIIANFENLEGSNFGDNLSGAAGVNFLDGQAGNDFLNGGQGSDWLMGGSGADLFIFDAGFGTDTIMDFEDAMDQIQFRIAGLTSFSQLSVTQDGADTLVSYDGNSIRLTGIAATDITNADFAFSAPAPAEPVDDGAFVFEKNDDVDVLSEGPDSFDFKADVDITPIAEVMDKEALMDVSDPVYSELLQIGAELHQGEAITYTDANGILAIITPDDDGYWDMVG